MPHLSHIVFLLLSTLFLTTFANLESESLDMNAPQLPPPEKEGTKIDLSDGPASLADQLGPLVINKDGSTSRITNWQKMTEQEKQNTVKIVTKRNRARLAALKAENEQKGEL